jgi:hypothetical protein
MAARLPEPAAEIRLRCPVTSLSPESAEESSGISGPDDTAEAPLFQLAEADADEAVERYDSPEAWMEADRKTMEAGDEFPDAEAEREKYESLYNEAVERRAARLDAEGKLPDSSTRRCTSPPTRARLEKPRSLV